MKEPLSPGGSKSPMDEPLEEDLGFEMVTRTEQTTNVDLSPPSMGGTFPALIPALDLAEDEDGEIEANDRTCLINPDDQALILPEIKTTGGANGETCFAISIQIFFPFLVAGFGMVVAGLVLDIVQHWTVFVEVSELFILVPALLGLKGNLEMTLASRLSTQANMGNMDTKQAMWSMVYTNLALVQCQAIVVGLVASIFAMLTGWVSEGEFSFDHGLLLCASSILTASVASFVLGLVMVVVIILSKRFKINPDNVATPIAASLGDLTTLVLLSIISSMLFGDLKRDKWLAPLIIVLYILLVPVFVILAKRNSHTEKVLYHGWTPVLCAMMISSLGGLILDQAISRFDGIAVFQPVMNGVGGNLVAVQASRLSTDLHQTANLGSLPVAHSRVCLSPWAIFVGPSGDALSAKILMSFVIPGHLIFTLAIVLMQAGHINHSLLFITLYLCAALIQVWILLHTAKWMIILMWKKSVDPDSSAIPYLTALGDLLGGGLLWMTFEILFLTGDYQRNESPILGGGL